MGFCSSWPAGSTHKVGPIGMTSSRSSGCAVELGPISHGLFGGGERAVRRRRTGCSEEANGMFGGGDRAVRKR